MTIDSSPRDLASTAICPVSLSRQASSLPPRPTLAPRGGLDAFFYPRSIAVVGASERPGSVGRTVLANLLSGTYTGKVFPINSKRATVLGAPSVPNLLDVPEPVDLAILVTRASSVPVIVEQCVEKRIPAAVVISAGFKELGAAGAELEHQILEVARPGNLRVLGPNCLGLMNPLVGLNATFANAIAQPGNVAFLSQSGALCTAILDWSLQEQVGFSAFVSVGSMIDVDWGDLIDYFGRDPQTKSILLYMESVGDARAFLSAAREVALQKPIIAIKAGRTEAASRAAASHTGSLAGSDAVFDAALRRVGVLRVERIADLFSMATLLARQPCPRGRRLTVVTNAGGPGVLATDALVDGGGELSEISAEMRTTLDRILPPHWSHANPIDVLGDAGPDRYAATLAAVARDPASDGLLVVLTPQDMTDPLRTAEELAKLGRLPNKPVLASFMGGATVERATRVLAAASIPNFPYPDTAARAFNYLWRYTDTLRNIYETPSLVCDDEAGIASRCQVAASLFAGAHAAGRTLLTEFESKQLLEAYGIPTVSTQIARSVDEAVAAAEKFGFPVVAKLYSESITHKTDVGGVQLNLASADDVRRAFVTIAESVTALRGEGHFGGVTVQPMVNRDGYELILGGILDIQFGPVIMFGAGGQLVEVHRDRAFALPPLNATLAVRLMEETRIVRALRGVRGRAPVDFQALEQILIRFGNLLLEQPWIQECEVNPLLASPHHLVALDARVILHPPQTNLRHLPHSAIRPYPMQYVRSLCLADGTTLRLRPIRLEDEPLMVKFHESLSDVSVRRRYFQLTKLCQRIRHERLVQQCFNDFDREVALVAEVQSPKTGERSIWGVGRLSRIPGQSEAEFAVIVGDPWQGRGIGTHLLQSLLQVARDEGIRRIVGRILPDNWSMQLVCKRLGFSVTADPIGGGSKAEIMVGSP